jgi:hypothetical protein
MMTTRRIALCLLILLTISALLNAQESGYQNRRSAIMNGNQVRTVFGNWGVIGQPTDTRPRGAWKNDNNGYLGDVSPFIGAEGHYVNAAAGKDTLFRSVITCPVARPTLLADQSPTGTPWTFEPEDGFFNTASTNQSVAMSNNANTWPSQWGDKDASWNGIWDGYFGKKKSADLETYFVMDDNNDQRFNFAPNNPGRIAFKPDSTDPSRNGMGIVVKVRGLQWASFLAQDNIFWLYDVNNTGTTNYDRAVFGMIVGTYHGVTGSADNHEYDDDWSFYDAINNITYTGDFSQDNTRNPRWVGNADGLVGYAFLESPGNPFDGIDNDGDADSSLSGILSPKFTEADFHDTILTTSMHLISIQDDYSRIPITIPTGVDSFKAWTHGMKDSIWLVPGRTHLVEGNLIIDVTGFQSINVNANDGIDNNFNGIIDENQYVHYRQYKTTKTTPKIVLFDQLRPVRHIDFTTHAGLDAYSMVDERRDDLIDNNKNWDVLFDDVGIDGIGSTSADYTGPDCGEADGRATSGVDPICNPAKTALPGEPHIDLTDVNESDQIGLTSFYYFTPSNQIRLGDDEQLWSAMAPGFYDVPASINFQPGTGSVPVNGEDGDFIYGSGYFPLRARSTERFSLALVYGGGKNGKGTPWSIEIADLLKHKKTVQKIYDANYQFPQPPAPPTLTAVPGDHKVTLYWNRIAESTVDPVEKIKMFEGYKVYRSTVSDFTDIFNITDASGTPVGYSPLAQFDLKDGRTGYFQPLDKTLLNDASGYSVYLGSDNGLQHSYVDSSVDNGRRYYYAVVAYTFGDDTLGVYPAENTHAFIIAPTGLVDSKDINVQTVVPNAETAGYTTVLQGTPIPHTGGTATGRVVFNVVDETKLTDHQYRIDFLDTQNDSIDNNSVDTNTSHMATNGRIDGADSTEWVRLTTLYSVYDETQNSGQFTSFDTVNATLPARNLDVSSVVITNQQGTVIDPSQYTLDAVRGVIRSSTPGSLPAGTYKITYNYYPVANSPYVQGSPFIIENKESDVFDGIKLTFANSWFTSIIENQTGWKGTAAYRYALTSNLPTLFNPAKGYKRPADYRIEFSQSIIDTSLRWPLSGGSQRLASVPINFRVYNISESTYVKCCFYQPHPEWGGQIGTGAALALIEPNPRGQLAPSWYLFFSNKEGDPADTLYHLTESDTMVFHQTQPFKKGDHYEFRLSTPSTNTAAAVTQLDRVRVVPNPYVTASSFEPPLLSGLTTGRGTRKVDFIHVPAGAVINIYTSRGDHVATLHQDGTLEDGAVSWNLRSSENLDVAYGIYFYVLESPVGNKTGKIAIIK